MSRGRILSRRYAGSCLLKWLWKSYFLFKMSAPTSTPSPAYLSEDIGPTILATASLMIIFATLFVILRYYARYLTQTKFGAEDIIIPFAWIAEIGICITGIVMVKKAGTGRHTDYLAMTDPGKITEHYKGIMILEVLHLPAVAFPKICIVLLYLKVFTNKWARMATWSLLFVIIATWFSYFIAVMFQCMPFAFNWDKTISGGKCFNVNVFSQSSSVPNIVTDVAVLLLPIRTVWDLKISVGRRIGLLLIFLTGSVGIIASIIRTVVFSRIDPLVDVTFTHTQIVNWTIVEPGMYLLAACALSFKPIFRMVAKALHLESFVTHSRSIVGKHTTKAGKLSRSTTHSDVRMDTLKTAQSGGFTKLSAGQDQVEDKFGKESGLKVMVTTTVEMDVEARSIRSMQANGGTFYDHDVGRAV
ncbi:hypothetical protein BDV96DRAFT_681862 [Lophiotrema nucula]|uniref:Rhodopsin domain-containing protein n=1 Tax=Lophiotrema nucula TaxID=690887 RepID=A0A6A5ZU77_9PLEO|nr:hypothetical protein BDV96DRAFT_681862 [Lophiotrema nucula]